jgi:opacity protein-like surface antigen
MKCIFKSIVLSACAGTIILACLTAHGQEHGFYFKADLGGALTRDTNLKIRLEPTGATPPLETKIQFDPGPRLGFAAGFQFTDWFAAEAELGAMVNTHVSGTSWPSLALGVVDVRNCIYANIPLLFNVRFQYPNKSRWKPYIGGGLGISAAIIDIETLRRQEILDTFVRGAGTDATAVFAYQAFGGLRYCLSKCTGLSLEYRYFVAENPTWEGDFRSSIRFDTTQTHALSVAFDWSF